jgi:peptidoglycan/LPS O-acetylase OafA/YrhL
METTNPLTYEAFRLRSRMLPLDGVRAFAVLGVLLHHTRNDPFGRLHGFRGVPVFFVLSGFLITTLALREEAARGQLDVRAFAIRRVFRIMPLFYMALAAYFLWAYVFGMESNGDLLRHYLPSFLLYCPEFPIFQHNFTVPFGQAWSLGIEEKFYLVWPLLAFWWLARSRHRAEVTVGLLAVAAGLTATNGVMAQMWGSYSDILIGCLLALLLHERAVYNYFRWLGRTEVTCAVLVLLGVALLSRFTGTQIGERLFALSAALAIAALVMNAGRPAAFAGNTWLVRIGAWSYAIYLTHPMVFDVLGHVLPAGRRGDYLSLVLTLAIDLPLCWLLHTRVEKPLIAVGRRITAQINGDPLAHATPGNPAPLPSATRR